MLIFYIHFIEVLILLSVTSLQIYQYFAISDIEFAVYTSQPIVNYFAVLINSAYNTTLPERSGHMGNLIIS